MSRRSRSLVIVSVIAALFLPVLANRDSFPISTYPMYAGTRGTEVSFVTAQGIDADGSVVPLSLATIGASDDPLVVAGELRDVVRLDQADSRCRVIAGRLGARGGDDFADVEAVELVTERHDTVASLRGEDSLRDRTVHARCGVGG
ncbi:hypothetical protein [Ilumatobacter nonamiensis]|uniref:hypothetical protein n=1 Tax=Ilumatobacter nonamiensis TaxID=467093 RepID=UPI0011D1EBC7|nr:hypothetical protein [Ilumatobacter nonamiensis]